MPHRGLHVEGVQETGLRSQKQVLHMSLRRDLVWKPGFNSARGRLDQECCTETPRLTEGKALLPSFTASACCVFMLRTRPAVLRHPRNLPIIDTKMTSQSHSICKSKSRTIYTP